MEAKSRHGSILSAGRPAVYEAERSVASLCDPRRVGDSETQEALALLPTGVPALIRKVGALVIPRNLPARVWDTDLHGEGTTPWLYCMGTSRQFQLNVEPGGSVRVELCMDPSWLRPHPAYAPITHDDAFWQPEGWPFVRFHVLGRVKIGAVSQ